jgi:AraC family transcriptional regulator
LPCRAQDRPFEEQHAQAVIAVVVSGTFQYRTSTGIGFMTPGSVLLGNPGKCFCCGHEHGTGDRCVAFSYAPYFLEHAAALDGSRNIRFASPRIPAVRTAATAVLQAGAYLSGHQAMSAEELSIHVAGEVARIARDGNVPNDRADAATLSRVTRVVRMIDADASAPHDLSALAGITRLSHKLRRRNKV